MEIRLPELQRLDPDVGMGSLSRLPARPVLYANSADLAATVSVLHEALEEWLERRVWPWTQQVGASEQRYESAVGLCRAGGMMRVECDNTPILPMPVRRRSPADEFSYGRPVDVIASSLAGREIFPGAGPLRRVVPGGFRSGNKATLLTDPIPLGTARLFSLVLRLSLETLPGLSGEPVLLLDVSRRRWVPRLKDWAGGMKRLQGYALPANRQDQAFAFGIVRRQKQDRSWAWLPDDDFGVIRDAFDLPAGGEPEGSDIVAGRLSTERCELKVNHHYRIDSSHSIGDGVPERDKLDAFSAVAEVIRDLGFEPLGTPRKVAVGSIVSPATSKHIPAGAILHEVAGGEGADLSRSFWERLEERLGYGLDTFEGDGGPPASTTEESLLVRVRTEHQERVRGRHPSHHSLLLVLLEPAARMHAKLIQESIRALYGNAFDLDVDIVPEQTFGPKEELNGKDLPSEKRYEERVRAWEPLSQRLAGEQRPVHVLVVARREYETALDDEVNKAAARRTLASKGRASVQFLTPPARGRTGRIDLQEFSFRLQSAMRDLVYGHAGEIDVPARFGNAFDPAFQPSEILGFTILRQNSTRSRSRGLLLPIAFRLDLVSGAVEAQTAHLSGGGRTSAGWVPLREALMDAAGANASILGDREANALAIRTFVRRLLNESVAGGRNPVVMVKTSMEMTGIWQGLKDTTIHRAGPVLEENGRSWHEEFPGARLVRLRQNHSPRVIGAKRIRVRAEDTGDSVLLDAPTRAPGLFPAPVSGNGSPTYWSVGDVRLQVKRGLSCYRDVVVGGLSGTPVVRKAHRKDWPAAGTLEIAVGAHLPGDNPERIAALIHALRSVYAHYSDATALPAPIFFETKFRNYLGEFSLVPEFDEESEG